jgi:hypothetical protein
MAGLHAGLSSAKNSFDEVLARLIRADQRHIPDIVSALSPRQRASLAVFCYGRGHLHQIGLAVAATCDLHSLMHAAPSNAAGQVLFELSRERPKPADRVAGGSRPRITLARSASGNSGLAQIIATMARDEAAECQTA